MHGHGWYGSTSCCISQCINQWKRAYFDPHSSETTKPILMKFEPYNYLKRTTHCAKFQFDPTTWLVSANTQFATVRLISFFVSWSPRNAHMPLPHIGAPILTTYTSYDVFSVTDMPFRSFVDMPPHLRG